MNTELISAELINTEALNNANGNALPCLPLPDFIG
jgi:hypothetical protein